MVHTQSGPGEAAVSAMTQESENPERVWNPDMATTTALEIANLANSARASQVGSQGFFRDCNTLADLKINLVFHCIFIPEQGMDLKGNTSVKNSGSQNFSCSRYTDGPAWSRKQIRQVRT